MAKQSVEGVLNRQGKPQRMRFDNGTPFANTNDRSLPTALCLWLVAIGIEVVYNRVRSPQQNGSVECTQRISRRWANIPACQNPQELQKALDQVAYEHIHVLRQRAKGDKTRAQQYPQLFRNPRKYDPYDIDPQRIKDYLSQFKWVRKVYTNGRISLFGNFPPIGTKYAKQNVSILFDRETEMWSVQLTNGTTVRQLQGPDLSIEAIKNLTIFKVHRSG